jgi:hypothetical protein
MAPKKSARKSHASSKPVHELFDAMNAVETVLAAYEATGDHDHGRGPIAPGAPCPGGDCLVTEARRMIAARRAS